MYQSRIGLVCRRCWRFLTHRCMMMSMSPETDTQIRRYRMAKRLDDVQETRRRITVAAVELH